MIAGIVGFPDPWLFEQCGLTPELRRRGGGDVPSGLDQPAADCVARQVDAVAHAELVRGCSARWRSTVLMLSTSSCGDLLRRLALGDQLEHLELAGSERFVLVLLCSSRR